VGLFEDEDGDVVDLPPGFDLVRDSENNDDTVYIGLCTGAGRDPIDEEFLETIRKELRRILKPHSLDSRVDDGIRVWTVMRTVMQ